MPYAIIEASGKQYMVNIGSRIKTEKMPGDDSLINFDKVLFFADGGNIHVGRPYLENVRVSGERLQDNKHKKALVFRYHSKTRYRKKKGHRQPYTEILIKDIVIK